MDLPTAASLSQRLMEQHGLIAAGWRFAWNHGRRTLGLCRYHPKTIELSVHFCLKNSEEQVRDTVLHEIAHALAGHKAGHGIEWQMACMRIGAKPERTCGSADMPKGKWRALCGGCQTLLYRHRRPMRHATYSCRQCGEEKGKLIFSLG